MNFLRRGREALATDVTLQRVKRYGAIVARAAPLASVEYVVEKVPVVFWLPKYRPRWALNDLLAGITVGVLLIPQSLAYAKIATIPGQYGLMSSWLPNFLYFFMGTSKDMSTGPTSLTALLTAEIIGDVANAGYSVQAGAAAVAMSIGIYCLAVGLLKLGFLLEFVSIPVLHGFISAAGIVIMLGQIPSLFGVTARTGTAHIIHDVFAGIPDFDGPTCGVGLGGILLLVLLQKMGQKWGKKNVIIWFISLSRSALVLILFTGISYGVNKNKDDPIWALSKVQSKGIVKPHFPETVLIRKVFARAVAPFLACAIEHLAIAKAYGRRNNYVIDPAQELVYLGVTNFFNAFFQAQPVGGAMSRTAVNSDTGVRSPMYGFVAGGVVILSIYKLSPALYWIPKATLAAIIVVAVMGIISSPMVFYRYWRTSLVDFTASMLSFWVTLFVNTEAGIGSAVGFNIVFHVFYAAFTRVRRVSRLGEDQEPFINEGDRNVPADTQVFKPMSSMIFHNAFHIKGKCFDVVQTYNSGAVIAYEVQKAQRNWSVSGERRMHRLRKHAGIDYDPASIRSVVLDMSMIIYMDTTALVALEDLRWDLLAYGGTSAELRFVNMKDSVRERFARYGWELYDADQVPVEQRADKKGNVVYKNMKDAVSERSGSLDPEEIRVVGDEKV